MNIKEHIDIDEKDPVVSEKKDLDMSSENVTDVRFLDKKDDSQDLIEPEVVLSDEGIPNIDDMPEEDFKKLLDEELVRQSKKITVTALSEDLMKRLNQTVAALEELHAGVVEKNQQALEKNNQIRDMVFDLVKSGHIQVNEEEFKRSEESVLEYVRLLDEVKQEIESELSRAIFMKNAKIGEECTVWKEASDDYEDFVEKRIKSLKHYAKSVKRDLAVSYSRYCFGFDSQIKRIDSIRRFVSRSQQR